MGIDWAWIVGSTASISAICIGIAYKEPHASKRLLRPTIKKIAHLFLLLGLGTIFGATYVTTKLGNTLDKNGLELLKTVTADTTPLIILISLCAPLLLFLDLVLGWVEETSLAIKSEAEKTKS